jgi:hypothetical protein
MKLLAPRFAAVGVLLVALSGTALSAFAQDAKARYPKMAPVEQYLMDRNEEISLARTAAPDAISADAKVMVLTRQGFETAAEGKNGFVCFVERAWTTSFDFPEIWNPRIRGPICLNPPAARSVFPIESKITELRLAGNSEQQIIDRIKTAYANRELPTLEPGAMCYMMSRLAYLTDAGNHNAAHLMFYVPLNDEAEWGARVPNSPVGSASYWFPLPSGSAPQVEGLPILRVFTVRVPKWSDGSPDPPAK